MKTHKDLAIQKKVKYDFLKLSKEVKAEIWNDLILECQKIVNLTDPSEESLANIKEIQETVRNLFICDYLSKVHENDWNKKLESVLEKDRTIVKGFKDFGHYCSISNNCIKVKNGDKVLIEVDRPSIYKLLHEISTETSDPVFFIFCIMNTNGKTEDELYQIYGLKEYYRIIHNF